MLEHMKQRDDSDPRRNSHRLFVHRRQRERDRPPLRQPQPNRPATRPVSLAQSLRPLLYRLGGVERALRVDGDEHRREFMVEWKSRTTKDTTHRRPMKVGGRWIMVHRHEFQLRQQAAELPKYLEHRIVPRFQ